MNGSAQPAVPDLGDPALNKKIEEWFAWDQCESTKANISMLIKHGKIDELRGRLLERLAFGTAGLRGSMGAGFNHMNALVIIQTTQGLAKYLLKTQSDITARGVVIGFDNRHNSSRFAQLAAGVLISQSIPVHLFSTICPTPYVPYTVLNLGCGCGIMVTASHNPKQDNGYKVYWQNGAQITSPHDKGIAAAIEENLVPWPSSWNDVKGHELLKDPLQHITENYMRSLKTLSHFGAENAKSQVKFVYTPMHGVGQEYVMQATKVFQLRPFISVEKQVAVARRIVYLARFPIFQ